MVEKSQFQSELERLILIDKEIVNNELLPSLKKEFNLFYSSFGSIYKSMLKEGLVQEDIYRKSVKLSDISKPQKDFVQVNRTREEISTRLSNFDCQLEFLLSYCPFSLDYLTNKRLVILSEFVKFLDWDNLFSGSPDFNTQCIATLFSTLPKSQHEITFQIVTNAQKQLQSTSRKILQLLKNISEFARENYKYDIRIHILNSINYNEEEVKKNPEILLKPLVNYYRVVYPKGPLHKELFQEVIYENFSSDAQIRQSELLQKLQEFSQRNKKPQKIEENSADLLEKALKSLLQCNTFLQEALLKVDANYYLCKQKSLSFWEKILRLLKLKESSKQERICEIIFEDEETGIQRHVNKDLDQFIQKRKQLISATIGLYKKFVNSKDALTPSDEEIISNLLATYIIDFSKSVKELNAFNEFFKLNVTQNNRFKLKGVKIEMSALVQNIANTRTLKNQYIAKVESAAQKN